MYHGSKSMGGNAYHLILHCLYEIQRNFLTRMNSSQQRMVLHLCYSCPCLVQCVKRGWFHHLYYSSNKFKLAQEFTQNDSICVRNIKTPKTMRLSSTILKGPFRYNALLIHAPRCEELLNIQSRLQGIIFQL